METYSGEGDDYPLQYSCLENSVDTGAWWATIYSVTKSRTWLSGKHTLCMKVKEKVLVTESSRTLCNTVGCSPPSSSVHRVLQTSILEWVTMPFSRGSSLPRNGICASCWFFTSWATGKLTLCLLLLLLLLLLSRFSHVRLCVTP